MVRVISDLNDFFSSNFKNLSIGLTPSGNLHVGFLTVLACALMYLKENPKSNLIITSMENSLDTNQAKYNFYPIRFQTLEDGRLVVPEDIDSLRERDKVTSKVQSQLKTLVWKLVQLLDAHNSRKLDEVKGSSLSEDKKNDYKSRSNKIYRLFGRERIVVFSFLSVLNKNRKLRQGLFKLFTDTKFAKIAFSMVQGDEFQIKTKRKAIVKNGKEYRPSYYYLPLWLYCPDCRKLCSSLGKMVFADPRYSGPTIESECKNREGRCNRANSEDPRVFLELKDSFENLEFHYLMNFLRDFFEPFRADCHLYGGDYSNTILKGTGVSPLDKIVSVAQYVSEKTGKELSMFVGPMILMKGYKMSKTGKSLDIEDFPSIKKIFMQLIYLIEEIRESGTNSQQTIDIDEIIRRAA